MGEGEGCNTRPYFSYFHFQAQHIENTSITQFASTNYSPIVHVLDLLISIQIQFLDHLTHPNTFINHSHGI